MAADMEKIETILMENEERLEKTLSVFKSDLLSIRVGRANPHVLDKVMVDYYGTPRPLTKLVICLLWTVNALLLRLGISHF